jgi:uracil-DNA glycosylase
VANASASHTATPDEGTAAPLIPPKPTIKKLQLAAAGCKACHLWKRATQIVFGEGRPTSTVMFVGEQPGNAEDLQGRPFVGPAENLLDEALDEAGSEGDFGMMNEE